MVTRCTASEALALVPDGAHLVAAPGCGAPSTLLAALGHASAGRGWTLGTGILLGELDFLPAVLSGDLAYRTWHVPAGARKVVAGGAAAYVPLRASRVAAHLAGWGVGAALVRVSPPDREGRVSLGGSVGYGLDALALASVRIGEVDPAVPRTRGASTVDVSVFDALVEAELPMPTYVSATPDATSLAIAERVLGLLPRDPTLQIGIGGIPESVIAGLARADLGRIRFEGMGGDAMAELVEAGGVTLRSPELMGTRRLMDLAHDNPAIELHPSSSSHDVLRLGALDRLVSVNGAVEVDLRGQLDIESVRGRPVAGLGGALDFTEGAARSVGGLRIVALASTSPDGTSSRIVPAVGTVSVPAGSTDVFVTEHGVASLEGLSERGRAEAMIGLAHPDRRDALAAQLG